MIIRQMKKKFNVSEDFTDLDNLGRTKTNLKQSGKCATRSKSVWGNTIPETV